MDLMSILRLQRTQALFCVREKTREGGRAVELVDAHARGSFLEPPPRARLPTSHGGGEGENKRERPGLSTTLIRTLIHECTHISSSALSRCEREGSQKSQRNSFFLFFARASACSCRHYI